MVQLTFTRGSQAKIEWMEAINMHASDPLPEPFPLPDLTVLRWLETDPDQYMQRDLFGFATQAILQPEFKFILGDLSG